jgi:predicted nuclease with TOPRIM domain
VDAARTRVRLWRRAVVASPCDGDARDPRIKEFEVLIERLVEKAEQIEAENLELKDRVKRLEEENKRLRGG